MVHVLENISYVLGGKQEHHARVIWIPGRLNPVVVEKFGHGPDDAERARNAAQQKGGSAMNLADGRRGTTPTIYETPNGDTFTHGGIAHPGHRKVPLDHNHGLI